MLASNMFHSEAACSFNYCNLLCWNNEQNLYQNIIIFSLLISILRKLLPNQPGNATTIDINLAAKHDAGD
jgi:hypothetical protein